MCLVFTVSNVLAWGERVEVAGAKCQLLLPQDVCPGHGW